MFVCVCKVISVSSFREVVFFPLCVRLWLAGHGAEREEETCARTNDKVSGLSLLWEGGVSRCAPLHRRPHQTGRPPQSG